MNVTENRTASGARYTLLRIGTLREKIGTLEERYLRLSSEQERMTKMLSFTGGTGGGCFSSRLENLTCEKDELERKLRALADEYTEALDAAQRLIGSCAKEKERKILSYRYLDEMSYPVIAMRLEISCDWAKKLCAQALRALDSGSTT